MAGQHQLLSLDDGLQATTSINMGHDCYRELARRVDSFVLRRTNELNAKYLPPLTNYVAFCRPSQLQVVDKQACIPQHFHPSAAG